MLATKLKVVSNKGAQNPVYRAVTRFAVEGLGDLIRVLMENVDDALFELADKVDNDRERNMYFEAMREIRLKRDSLKRQLDELKRIEDEPIPTDLIRDEDGNLVNARGILDDDGNVIDD